MSLRKRNFIGVLVVVMLTLAGCGQSDTTLQAEPVHSAAGASTTSVAAALPRSARDDSVETKQTMTPVEERDIAAWTEGAAPTIENYKSWNIQPDGLRITFDPYQVASYAAGHQTIVVPYAELGTIIRADGPLASFAP